MSHSVRSVVVLAARAGAVATALAALAFFVIKAHREANPTAPSERAPADGRGEPTLPYIAHRLMEDDRANILVMPPFLNSSKSAVIEPSTFLPSSKSELITPLPAPAAGAPPTTGKAN